jgi:hypothetical protein
MPTSDPQLQQATDTSREICLARGWKTYRRKNGEDVKLRQVLEKISNWVLQLIPMVDFGVSLDASGHAAIPWTILKFSMSVSSLPASPRIVDSFPMTPMLIAR